MLYTNLIIIMIRHEKTFEDIARVLNIKTDRLMSKIAGDKDFTLKEVKSILNMFPDVEYEELFKKSY